MCIKMDDTPQAVRNGELKLWKVIMKNNRIGIWFETVYSGDTFGTRFEVGFNVSRPYKAGKILGEYHCFFTRKEARKYIGFRKVKCGNYSEQHTKIINVYANSCDVVSIGYDVESHIRAISVSKMEIKSLKHQR